MAPVAKKVPFEMTEHGDTRVDDYFWMRLSDAQKEAETPDAQTQEVLDYLAAENDYIDSKLAHTEALQQKLFDEIVGRIKKDDRSVPVRNRGYWYYTRYEEGKEYAINCRKAAGMRSVTRTAPVRRRCCLTRTRWPRGTITSPWAAWA